jgi:hypothetical protein
LVRSNYEWHCKYLYRTNIQTIAFKKWKNKISHFVVAVWMYLEVSAEKRARKITSCGLTERQMSMTSKEIFSPKYKFIP